MCTLFIYRSDNTDWPVLIANNRDEYFSRSFYSPGRHWDSHPYIFAGKDLQHGGSWLGVNKYGLCACILNRNSGLLNGTYYKSRGDIVINILKYKSSKTCLEYITKDFKNNTKYFNLFISDYKYAFWIKYNEAGLKVSEVPYGYSILDNYDLNDKKSIKQNIYKKIFMKQKIPNPDINCFKDWKSMLFLEKKHKNIKHSSVYVQDFNKNYGTVCSSIIGLPDRNRITNNIFWLYSENKNTYKKILPFKN
ncbi:MAG: hypothetical protein CMP36_00725 [Rickettsiales bacterium]|nr:hypothetical protein [Rickettsiales bacterium]OUV83102.1 MAG: hypothetical protein CBC91_01105 [Rickettsiales bacterium TMED131]